ncbi:unnamed protein product [Arabis nemorensis]|uniref:Uncharacterized protein n=1 Tax=Arabis nemorensis TaxID=586526 RepID=A0A565B994_9BRAS|nr:unnamed protein product [Arabis nemorensis]
MPPTSAPLKFFMEDIEKTQSLSGKCVKIEAYIATIKEDRNKVKDLNVPICKQILDDAIKTLEVERDKFLAEIKDILNRTGIIDVNASQEEMISVFQNLSPTLTNNVVQPAPANANPTATNTGKRYKD